MKSQLIESIAMMIDSLTHEEKALLKQKVELFRVNSKIAQLLKLQLFILTRYYLKKILSEHLSLINRKFFFLTNFG